MGKSKTAKSLRRAAIETLEPRMLLSVNILSHGYDAANDSANLSETVLTPANVNATNFGELFKTTLDGQMYAEPLYVQNVNITRGNSTGVHSVVYAATQNDSLYAIDANTGVILWQDSFLNVTNPESLTPTTGVTTISSTAIDDNGAGPELGILATPAIDASAGEIFLTANTTEIRGNDTHYVQRLWAINIASGAVVNSTVIADTIFDSTNYTSYTGYQYVSGPIVDGAGSNDPTTPTPTYPNNDGWISAPGSATGYVIAYNALQQMQRTAVTLINGNLYLASASHGDDGPYYGWVLGYSESTLALDAAFVTTPTYAGIVGNKANNTAQGGIWMSGSEIATDGTYLYLTTGNGAFNPSPSNFNAQGFPIDNDYGDSLLKLAVDPSSSPTNQNGNGWGLKVADYFTPSNENELNEDDFDLGSTGVTLLPNSLLDTAGNPMLVIGGKEGTVYLVDRDNLGKFNDTYPSSLSPDPRLYDRVVGEFDGEGGIYGSPAYFNGNFYVGGADETGLSFPVATFASGSIPPGSSYSPPFTQTSTVFGYPSPTFTISANGGTNGIVWGINIEDNVSDALMAYNAGNFTTPIYNSNTDAARDALGGGVSGVGATHFDTPTVANGMVYAGTGGDETYQAGTLLGYGLLNSYLTSNASYFSAPANLVATTPTSSDAHLTWKSNSTLATEFRIERSTDDATWTTLANVSGSTTSYDDTAITPNSSYYYRVTALSGASVTNSSNVAVINGPRGIFTGNTDIGAPPSPGSSSFSNGIYTVTGTGYDVWNNSDQFQYDYETLSGNGTIIAKVTGQTDSSDWAKAGVMFRNTLDADSAYDFAMLTPDYGVQVQDRTAANASAANVAYATGSAPYWLELTRIGNEFTAYASLNGTTWAQVGSAQTISMNQTVYVGLAVDSHNGSVASTATFSNVSVTALSSGPPPANLFTANADIGGASVPGSSTVANGVYTVTGSGYDVWNNSDQFQYDYETLSGNGTIIAEVTSQTDSSDWAKAGIMFRNTLDADSAYDFAMLTPAYGVQVQDRTAANASAANVAYATGSAPYWLELTRSGNEFTAYASSNGTTWTQVGPAQTIAMNQTVYVGLAVTSHNGAESSTATFANVSVTSATANPLGIFTGATDIGSPPIAGATTESNGVYSVTSDGYDVWNTSDQFQYAYETLTGDGSIIAEITGQTDTSDWAKAGVTFRNTLGADSSYAFLMQTPTYNLQYQGRTTTGGEAANINYAFDSVPYWIKLTRAGNVFTAYTSPDGANWTQIEPSETIVMNSTVYVGLAVTSNASTPSTATFANVSVT